jgi:hypothetical protein
VSTRLFRIPTALCGILSAATLVTSSVINSRPAAQLSHLTGDGRGRQNVDQGKERQS